jgi:hypothetical protein
MWMQSFRVRSNSALSMDTRPVNQNADGGAPGLPLIFATIMAIAALMSGCSRVQSSGQSKPQVLAQSSVMRTVTVTFDYDFSRFPACSTKITQKCVQQFNVYEVSAKPPIFLFTVPVPPNAKGKMTVLYRTASLWRNCKGPGGELRVGSISSDDVCGSAS